VGDPSIGRVHWQQISRIVEAGKSAEVAEGTLIGTSIALLETRRIWLTWTTPESNRNQDPLGSHFGTAGSRTGLGTP